MADLYVCPVCKQTEDCSCARLDETVSDMKKAKEQVRVRLGENVIAMMVAAPDLCGACKSTEAGKATALCPMCQTVARVKEAIRATRAKLIQEYQR